MTAVSTCHLKAGFHMIADDRGSQIADRRKFCDRLRSNGNTLPRSPAILRSWSQTIAEERTMLYLLRSSAIVCDPAIIWKPKFEMYPITFLILKVCFDFPASTTRGYMWHFRWTKCMATVGSAIVCDRLRLYGNSSLCDRLRSFAITWKPALNKTVLAASSLTESTLGLISPLEFATGDILERKRQ